MELLQSYFCINTIAQDLLVAEVALWHFGYRFYIENKR